MSIDVFDRSCRRCPRLAAFLDQVKTEHPNYHCAPVPPFGDPGARFLLVGLAPGMHGANASGRPFTGDHAGILLYQTLNRFGFASLPESVGLEDVGFTFLSTAIPLALGREVYQRRQTVERLEERAERAERERAEEAARAVAEERARSQRSGHVTFFISACTPSKNSCIPRIPTIYRSSPI